MDVVKMSVITIEQVHNLVVEATSFCNLHCPQCGRFTEDGFLAQGLQPSHLDFQTFSKAIKPGAFPNLRLVTFEGDYGDIMMHPDAKKFIEHCSSFANVHAVSNASMRVPQWWADLAKIKNLTVTFSIDGLQDTNHLYRINAEWEKIINNARAFIENGGQARWKFIVFKHNQHQIQEAKKLAHKMGFVDFETVVSNRNFYGSKIWPVKIDGKFVRNLEMTDLARSVRDKTHIVTSQLVKNNDHVTPSCEWAKFNKIYLNFKGHLLPCCMTSQRTWMDDMSARLWMRLVGNVNDIDISKHSPDKILQSEFYKNTLEQSFANKKRVHHACVANCAKNCN
jgi:MoaA/NifB/PqqE/SkfB family radical SAM enzyme